LGVTSRQLGRLFVRHLGATPFDVGLTRRAHFAKKLIDETTLPFEEVAYAAGFGSVRRFNEDIRLAFSRTPTELRRLARQPGPAAPGRYVFRLAYRPPYDWHAAMGFFDAHSIHGVERVEPDRYARTIDLDGRTGTILVTPIAAAAALDVQVCFPDTRALLVVVERVRRMFDLAAEPAVIADHLRQDPLLRRALVAHPGIRCVRPWDGFELAVRALLDDRIILDGVAATLGTRVDASPLQRVFPTPTQLQDAPLERIGVAVGRAESIRQLARAVVHGTVRFAGSDAATLAAALASIPRVGARMAEFIAASTLDEPDAFDPRIRRTARGATPRDLEARSETWRPWRAYAAMLLWQQGANHAQTRVHSISDSVRRNDATDSRRRRRVQGRGTA
jgi:AraC family transcriptional regulator of adaptative response / DNA-3-methyladenine glycosylase II